MGNSGLRRGLSLSLSMYDFPVPEGSLIGWQLLLNSSSPLRRWIVVVLSLVLFFNS